MEAPAEKSSTGLEPNVAGMLSYILIAGIIFFFIEKESKFVKFHALQSTIFLAVMVVLWIALFVLSLVLAVIPVIGWVIGLFLYFVLGVGAFILWVVLMVKSYQGERWKIPLIGNFVEQQTG